MATKQKSVKKSNNKKKIQRDALSRLAKDIISNAGVGIYIVQHGKFVYVSDLYQKITGYTESELIGAYSLRNIHPDDKENVRENAIKCLKENIHKPYEYRFVTKNNEVIWILETVSSIVYNGKRAALGSFMNITERKIMEKELRQSEEKYRTILENIQEGYFEVDLAGNFTFFNDPVCQIIGYPREELMGMNDRVYTNEETAKKVYQAFNKVYKTGKPTKEFDWQIIRRDGAKRYIEASVSLKKDLAGRPIGFKGIIRDITERKEMDKQLNYMVTHDSLTGLPNRMLFMDRLQVALAQSKRNKKKLAVMMLDLDNFKDINDALGHMVGDKLLKDVGCRLTGILRQSDTVARLGGDEFMILLSNLEKIEYAAGVAKVILKSFQKPFLLANNEVISNASVGIAIFPDDCDDVDSLLKKSDMAMYSVKKHGRNSYKFFSDVTD
ncbi:MAG: PAS domain S-box protein [Syntrophaceae bacterium]|nr:PAS domain S-box protein [Syntrophaceae bacterium]